MKYNPTINCSKSGNTITRNPKMIAIKARTGLDMVTPIDLRLFSIVSPIIVASLANSTAKANMAYVGTSNNNNLSSTYLYTYEIFYPR
jgi:hypothetical protein